MPAEQLPATVYLLGGQITVANFVVINTSRSFEEDTETKHGTDGRFSTEITYSRRETVQAQCDALSAATPHTYMGGTIASGSITLADGSTASAWKIRNAAIEATRGVRTVTLDLIQLGDKITAP